MAKKDLSDELKALYFPTAKEPAVVDVPSMQFAMVDGEGNPNDAVAFRDAIGALYGVAYTIKFTAKKAKGPEIRVMPLEALWWAPGTDDFSKATKEEWHWTAMILEPPTVTRRMFDDAVRQLREKKNPPSLSKVRLAKFREGKSAQILHIGPYAEETATIQRLHAFIRSQGYRLSGKHHEIYLSIPGRTAPARMKTVVRQPMSR